MTRSTVDGRPRLSEPRNHFERLKAMSMEEMAVWFNKGFVCPPKHGCPKNEASCEKCWLEWLKEEVEDAQTL